MTNNPSRFAAAVGTLTNVRAAAKAFQDGIRSPGDEDALPDRVEDPFFPSDHVPAAPPPSRTNGASSPYFQGHPLGSSPLPPPPPQQNQGWSSPVGGNGVPPNEDGRPLTFSLTSNPQTRLRGTIVRIENDESIHLRDVFDLVTYQLVHQTVTYHEYDIDIHEAGFDASPTAASPTGPFSPISPAHTFPMYPAGNLPFGATYPPANAHMPANYTSHRCGYCNQTLQYRYCQNCFLTTHGANSLNCYNCNSLLTSFCSPQCFNAFKG